MNKYLKYTLRGLAILAGIFILLFISAYIYVTAKKKEIIQQVREEVAEKLNGDVQLGNVELTIKSFPNISILLEKVSITDTLFKQHNHPFFKAEKVYAVISVSNMMSKKSPLSGIRIENGQLYVFTDTSGYTNSYLFSPKSNTQPKTGKSTKTEIDKIRFSNVRLILDDQKKRKLYDFDINNLECKIKANDSISTIQLNNDILIHSLAFNTAVGSYVKETPFAGKFRVLFNKNKKQLSFDNIDITLKKHPFTLTGAFNFTDQPTFSLKIISKNIDYNFARGLLTQKLAGTLSMIKVEDKVDEVTADLSGPLKGGEPLVKVSWKISDNYVESPFAALKDCSLTGSFINEIVPGLPRKDPNSRLHFENVSGKFEGLPITSKEVFIDNLQEPVVKCDVKSSFNLSQLNDLIGSRAIHMHDGTGTLDITYQGPLKENSYQNTLLNGKFSFINGLVAYHPKDIEIKNVSGNILFKNTDVFVNDIKGNVLGNKIVMNGSGKNLLALMKTSPGKVLLEWNIYLPSLNLNAFNSLLKKRASADGEVKKTKLGTTGRQLDELVSQANFKLNVQAAEFKYDRFKANNVKASLALVNENWILNNVSMRHADGFMSVNGSLIEKNNQFYGAKVNVNMQDVDVNKVMFAFDNFGQNGITSDNLKGRLTTTASVNFDLERNTQKPSNLEGFVDFSIKNGALLHYEPLKKVQKVVFKKRNFDEINFAELKDKIEIKGKQVTINRMEIQSSVLSLFVEGTYNLDPEKGNTEIGIQIPISNFKKRGEDYVPENKGAESKGGASVFVRGRPGSDGKLAFKLDVFKKFRKKDKKGDKDEDNNKENKKDEKADKKDKHKDDKVNT